MPFQRILCIAAVATMAACGAKKSGMSVSVANAKGTAPGAATASSPPAPSASPSEELAAAGIQITALYAAVRDFELEDGTCPPPPGGTGAPSSCSFEVGPIFVSLDDKQVAKLLDGSIPQDVRFAELPPGTYSELEVKVCPFEEEDFAKLGADAAAAREKLGDNSIAVALHITPPMLPGSETPPPPFDCTIPVKACIELERHVDVKVDASGGVTLPNVTLGFDVASWFKDVPPPRNPADCAALADRVAASLDAFEDDDRDGKCDD